jgi:hypothetical protein
MGANAKYNWRRSRQKEMQSKAGRLYEHLMAEVLGCEFSEKDLGYADIFSTSLGIRVEVKSRGDQNSLELRVNQVHEYGEDIPFPLNDTLYALVPYESTMPLRKGDPRPKGFSPNTHTLSLMRGLRTDAQRNAFWAQYVETSYLVDLRIVNALESYLGIHPCRMIGRGDEMAIRVSRTTLEELFGDGSFAQTIKELGLSPSGWAKGVYPIYTKFTIDGQRLTSKFTLVTVLRKRLHAKIAERLSTKALTLE